MARLKDILEMARLKGILEPGERVVLRVPLIPIWQPVLMAISGLAVVLLQTPHLADSSLDFVLYVAHTAVGFLMLAVGVLIYFISRISLFLVTDRRLMQPIGPQPYKEIPLAEIEEIKPYRLGDGLFVTGRGQKLVIPCKEKTAARIRAAIEAAKGGA